VVWISGELKHEKVDLICLQDEREQLFLLSALMRSHQGENTMSRSMHVLALTLCGMLFGCGGEPVDGAPTQGTEAPATQAEPTDGHVSVSALYSSYIVGAYVTFDSYGDHFFVRDERADGHAAVAHIHNHSNGNYTYCWNTNGAGTTVDCNRDFPEGIRISFRACSGEYSSGRLISCASGWTYASTGN
jgi:hypothetical protein